jgi:hypothetical protein
MLPGTQADPSPSRPLDDVLTPKQLAASPSSGYKTEKGKHLIFIILLQVISILFIYYKYMQRNKTVACMVTHALTCLFCMNKFYHRHDSVATAHYIQCRLGSVTVSVTSATLLSVRLGNDIMPQLTSTSQRHDQRRLSSTMTNVASTASRLGSDVTLRSTLTQQRHR